MLALKRAAMRGFPGSYLCGCRTIFLDAGIGQDVRGHIRIGENEIVAPFIQFGQSFRGRGRYFNRVSTGLQNSLQSQSRGEVSVY